MRNLFISGPEVQCLCLDVVKTIMQMPNAELNKAMFRLAEYGREINCNHFQ